MYPAFKAASLWGNGQGCWEAKSSLILPMTPRTSMSCLLTLPVTISVIRGTLPRGQGNSWKQAASFIF